MTTKDEAMQRLHEVLKPGDPVYTVLRHVSKSGMSRRISLIALVPSEYRKGRVEPFQLDGLAEAVGVAKHKKVTRYGMSGDSWQSREEGLVVGGCGMDMGFELVYRLGKAMFPEGFKLPKGVRGRNGDTSGRDRDGGYAFEHKWL